MELAKKIQTARDTLKELLDIYEINKVQFDMNEEITQDILLVFLIFLKML